MPDAGTATTTTNEVARGEIVMTLVNAEGTFHARGTTRPDDPATLLRACIDGPNAPRPLSPSWMIFSIAIGEGATRVKFLESSRLDDAGSKIATCFGRALEGVRNTEGLSHGTEPLMAYVSLR